MKKCIIILILLLTNIVTARCPQLDRKQNNLILYGFQNARIHQLLQSVPFTPVYLELALEINVRHPDIVYAQARIETGNFSSHLFLKHNNVFGMHWAIVRKNTQDYWVWADPHHKKRGKVAGYNHWYDAVLDYKMYQQYYDSLGYNMDDYYSFLTKVKYSASKKYIKTLKKL